MSCRTSAINNYICLRLFSSFFVSGTIHCRWFHLTKEKKVKDSIRDTSATIEFRRERKTSHGIRQTADEFDIESFVCVSFVCFDQIERISSIVIISNERNKE